MIMEYKLDGVSETLLIPLWARAVETKRPRPIVTDDLAVKIIKGIDYDFSKFAHAWKTQVGVSVRTKLLDRATAGFVKAHAEAVIVNMGAGLDTRFFRLQNSRVDWYDLDLPEVIRFKKRFFQESSNYRMIGKSVLDFSWLDEVDAADRPVLIIAEGLLMYFKEAEVRALIDKLATAFPRAEMLVEMITPFIAKRSSMHDTVSQTGAEFKWGLKSGRELEAYHDKVRFIDEWNYFDFHKDRWKWMQWLTRIPFFKNRFNTRIVHLKFS